MNQSTVGRAMTRVALAATAAALIAGCAIGPQIVQTQVTNYNEWSALPADRSFAFARTLEYQHDWRGDLGAVQPLLQ